MRTTILFLLLTFSLNAQTLNELYVQSNAAFSSKEYKLFLQLTQKMDSMRPMHPKITYSLASAYALNSDMLNTYEILKRIAGMNSTVDIASDDTFAAFIKTDFYGAWQQFREQVEKPVIESKKVITLDEKDLHPEGLAYAKGTGWLAASIHKRKIISFDIVSGKCTDWLAGNDMLAVFSIKPDKQNKYLWAATAALPEMEGYDSSMEGKAEVLQVNLSTKQIVKRFPLDGGHLFGDLLVADSGKVFVSDSALPVIYTIENDTMTQWMDLSAEAFSLQGITINEKSHTLYIADYLKGILAISLNDKSHQWLDIPFAKGIDGLAFHNSSLFAIHNGTTPIRIVRYDLDGSEGINGFKILDNNRPEFNEPVQGTFHEGGFYFFGNAPWKAYDKTGNLIEGAYSNPELYCLIPK